MARIVADPAVVSAQWLTEVLHDNGIVAEIATVRSANIGTGQVGQNVRFELEYAQPSPELPPALVGKFPSPSPLSRATAIAGGVYRREVNFYNTLARTVAIQTPRILFSGIEADEAIFCIIMEDLAPAVQGDQMLGCSITHARLAIEQAAKLHAPRWGDASLSRLQWLSQPPAPDTVAEAVDFLSQCFAGFKQRYQDRLEPDHLDVARLYVDNYAHWLQGYSGPLSLIHCDYRPDNFMFDGVYPMAVVDWQTCAVGAPVYDVSYFLGAGVLPQLRREHERELLETYHRLLCEHGVQGYEFTTCWEDYRRFAFTGLRMAIHASMVVEQTERGDDMFVTMAARHAQQMIDLDALEFLH